MYHSIRDSVTNITRQEYRSDAKLEEQLGAFLKASIKELSVVQVYAFVNNLGCILANEAEDTFIDVDDNNDELHKPFVFEREKERSHKISAIMTDEVAPAHRRKDLSAPIRYQDKSLGYVVCQIRHDAINVERNNIFLTFLGREMAFLIVRHNVAHIVNNKLGKEFLFLGSSPQFREIEIQVERSATVDLPVILHGEFGGEFIHTAFAIHFCGNKRETPFVEINCAAKFLGMEDSDPKQWLQQAEGGRCSLMILINLIISCKISCQH